MSFQVSSIQFTKNKEYASQHPYFNCCESLSLGGVGVDVVEDVDEDKKESDQERHSSKKCIVLIIDIFIYNHFPISIFVLYFGDFAIQYVVEYYLPGTMSGGIKNDIQETTTNKPSIQGWRYLSPVCIILT